MDNRVPLTCAKRFSYGVGHVLNDLCASMWFSYLLVYLHYVIQFSNVLAGYLLLLGQIVDAICTPLVGYESDRTKGCGNYGRRKSWHVTGTLAVILSFPFIFNKCIGCTQCHIDDHSPEVQPCWVQFIYYAPFVAIFQFGWASTQISHLSLIPELTPNESDRVELNAIRYAFTVVSNLTVFCVAWILLGQAEGVEIDPSDQHVFTILTVVVIALGTVFSIIFHVGTKEKNPNRPAIEGTMLSPNVVSSYDMQWRDWFKEYQFYQVALLYMCTRLVVNVSQVYIPMYVSGTLSLEKHFIAIVPLIVFISGFVTSFVMKPMNSLLGRKLTYAIGAVLILGSCAWLYFLNHATGLQVIGSAILLGAGSSTILVTSLSITADLIGTNVNSGAFVYGAMSFTDKLSNGIAIALIQYFHPCKTTACCPDCEWYYRYIMVGVPGGMAILALVVLATLLPVKIGQLRSVRIPAAEDEQARLLGDNASINSAAECCDYGTCFGSSGDAQARTVTKHDGAGTQATGQKYTSLPEYGSANSDTTEENGSIPDIQT